MGNHFAGCGLLGIVIHFGIKSGNQQVVTYILVPKLIQLTIPQSPHPATYQTSRTDSETKTTRNKHHSKAFISLVSYSRHILV